MDERDTRPEEAQPEELPAEAPAAVPAAPSSDEPEVDLEFHPDGIDHELDPEWVTAQRLVNGITAAVFSGITLLGLIIATLASSWRGWSVFAAFGGWLLFAASILTWSQWGPALRYRRRRYRLDENGLRLRDGIVFHTEVSVPYSRIQHTDVSRGPIERSFGLATVIVHTAGTDNASVPLDGLPAARAYRIRDLLLVASETDDAV